MLLDRVFRSKKDDEYYFFFNYFAGCWYFFNLILFYPMLEEIIWGVKYSFLKSVIGFLVVLPFIILEGVYVIRKLRKMQKEEGIKQKKITQRH